jgi:trans-2,3-dihydro-3-hydroxyanthranilate isomerase
MAHRFHIVDVFAEELYAGNTLAVVRDAGDLDTVTMQRIAREFGFSETTFVTAQASAAETAASPVPPGAQRAERAEAKVRIFTPGAELPFAGHPTLGTAWVIREHLLAERAAALTLALGVGNVPVAFEAGADGVELAWLTAPPVKLERTLEPGRIAPALGLAPSDLATDLPVQEVRAGVHQLLVPLASLAAARRARLDPAGFAPLAAVGFPDHVYLFAREAEAPGNQLHSRMFFTAAGVREDPATGSATACLGAYLLAHGRQGDRFSLRIEQGVEMERPSLLRLEVTREAGAAKIRVGGRVLESARGQLL